MTTYPYIPIGLCPYCGEEVSLDKNVEFECDERAKGSPVGCIARYAQAHYDEGKRMRVH